jgi:hypothetical protein
MPELPAVTLSRTVAVIEPMVVVPTNAKPLSRAFGPARPGRSRFRWVELGRRCRAYPR